MKFLDYVLGLVNPTYRDAGSLVKETRIALGFEHWGDFERLWNAALAGIPAYLNTQDAVIPETRDQRWSKYLALNKEQARRAFLLSPDYPVPVGSIGQVIPEEEWLANKKRIADLLANNLCPYCTNSGRTKHKRIFSSRQEAAGFSRGYSELKSESIQREYECPGGYGWHLTTQASPGDAVNPNTISAIVTYTNGVSITVSVPSKSLDDLSVALLEHPETMEMTVADVQWQENKDE